MRFLVLGCNGMAGHVISIYLKEQGHNVIGFAKTKSPFVDTIIGNALDKASVISAVEKQRFDVIINCIGILNNSAEQHKTDAIYLNSFLPHLLAEITYETPVQVIHLSTDCVFSGKKIGGGYTESDLRDGETFYDRTKALGELEDDKNITLRTSIIGPDINTKGIGLLNWFLQQDKRVYGYTQSIWTGQTTIQLAKTIEAAAKSRVHGLYNIVPDNSISKYDLLKLLNKYLRNDSIEIRATEGVVADKSLKRTRWDFDFTIPSYEEMIIDLSRWMDAHKSLYPHYFSS